MKKMFLFAVFVVSFFLFPALNAHADNSRSWNVLIVDKDTHGTNMRSAPSGKIIKVIPYTKGNAARVANVTESSKGWFFSRYGQDQGWIHGSVLGTCAQATEDGDPSLAQAPNYNSPPVEVVPSDAPVLLLDMKNEWLKVQYLNANGDIVSGWLPEQAVAMGEGSLERCAKIWARQ